MNPETPIDKKKHMFTARNIFIAAGVIILVALAVAALSMDRQQAEASNFVECKDAGGKITDGVTPMCEVKGKTFENNDKQKQTGTSNSEYSSQYVGMSEKDALEKAKADDRAARVVERDGKSLIVTMDLRQGRLNFTIEDGTVTAVEEEAPDAKKNQAE